MRNTEIDKQIALKDFAQIKIECQKVTELIASAKTWRDMDKPIEQIEKSKSMMKNLIKFLESFPEQDKTKNAIFNINSRIVIYDALSIKITNQLNEIRKKYGEKSFDVILL